MGTPSTLLNVLPVQGRERLLALSREVVFPEGTRIFEEGGTADRFWIIRTGSVTLDFQPPGRRRPFAIETLGHGDLLGWSWLFPPYTWHQGAEAFTLVRATEFDAAAVRVLCDEDPVLGQALTRRVAAIVADRLQTARSRLFDMYGPHGNDAPLLRS